MYRHLQDNEGFTGMQLVEDQGQVGITTLIRNKKQETPLLGRLPVLLFFVGLLSGLITLINGPGTSTSRRPRTTGW